MDNAGDITNANCKVFSHSGIFGTMPDNKTVTGETSGATATIIHTTSRQILLDSISGTFQNGERVKYGTSDFVILTNAGDGVIIVGEVDGTISGTISISGFTTSATNKIILRSVPYNRHKGTALTGSRLTHTTTSDYQILLYIAQSYTYIQWLILEPSIGHTFYTCYGNVNNVFFENLVIHPTSMAAGTVQGHGIFGQDAGVTIQVSNSIIYEFNNSSNLGYGVRSYANGTINAYNVTSYDNDTNFDITTTGSILAKNNIAQGGDIADYVGSYASGTTHNLSSDASAPGTVNYRSKTVSFISTSTDNYHLSSTDTEAYNKGTDTTTTANVDIDGFDRDTSGVTWDLGADERWTNTTINGATLNGATIN